jgi:hypothetical protein
MTGSWQQLLEPLVVWDGGWYFTIASHGYTYTPGAQSTIAFFPLYPLIVAAAAWPLGGSPAAVILAGTVVSAVSFCIALVVLHGLAVSMTGSRESARRAITYLAVSPFAFYFTRLYTESLFLLLTVGAVALAHHSRWRLAGLVGALAAATRPNGIVILLPLAIMTCSGWPAMSILVRRLAAVGLVVLGPLAYSAYVWTLTGDPLAWLRAQAHWEYTLWHPPARHLITAAAGIERLGLHDYLFQRGDTPYELLYVMVALGALALTPRVALVCGAGPAAYVLASVLIPLSGNVLLGMGRYVSVLFPLFIALATLTSRRGHEVLLVGSALCMTLLQLLFVGWRPLF